MIQVSVIICCYNSEQRIGLTLESLLAQQFNDAVNWEVVIVDNNCTDKTVEVAQTVWESDTVQLRVVKESTPGLSAARDRGVAESLGEYILFCDDDNWLASNYLQIGLDFLNVHCEYAAIGGWGSVVTDEDFMIPDWFERFQTKYACGRPRNSHQSDTLVGAGIMIRKQALIALNHAGFRSVLSDRKGAALSSGGDLELCLALRCSDWKLQFCDTMTFRHYMPPERLSESYLLKMVEGHGASRSVLGEYRKALRGDFSGYKWFIFTLFRRSLTYQLVQRILLRGSDLNSRVRAASAKGSFCHDWALLCSSEKRKFHEQLQTNFKAFKFHAS